MLACYLLASRGTASSSRQDSQVKESIAGRRMKFALSIHGAGNMLYTVFHVCFVPDTILHRVMFK